MDETVYIVSGYMRTGTSMMMKALEAGGMTAVYRESRDKFREQYTDDDYDPNEGGLYELERKDYTHPDFPEMYKGKLIKLLNAGMIRMLVVPKIKVIFMRRDFEEVRQSYQAFFASTNKMTEAPWLKVMENNIALLRNRRDTELEILWYRDVVDNPLQTFITLRDRGWPIDPEKAALVVDPTLCRFKRENLDIGVI